jgi:hypothetical protein
MKMFQNNFTIQNNSYNNNINHTTTNCFNLDNSDYSTFKQNEVFYNSTSPSIMSDSSQSLSPNSNELMNIKLNSFNEPIRQVANVREQQRTQSLNSAFESLRRIGRFIYLFFRNVLLIFPEIKGLESDLGDF